METFLEPKSHYPRTYLSEKELKKTEIQSFVMLQHQEMLEHTKTICLNDRWIIIIVSE